MSAYTRPRLPLNLLSRPKALHPRLLLCAKKRMRNATGPRQTVSGFLTKRSGGKCGGVLVGGDDGQTPPLSLYLSRSQPASRSSQLQLPFGLAFGAGLTFGEGPH